MIGVFFLCDYGPFLSIWSSFAFDESMDQVKRKTQAKSKKAQELVNWFKSQEEKRLAATRHPWPQYFNDVLFIEPNGKDLLQHVIAAALKRNQDTAKMVAEMAEQVLFKDESLGVSFKEVNKWYPTTQLIYDIWFRHLSHGIAGGQHSVLDSKLRRQLPDDNWMPIIYMPPSKRGVVHHDFGGARIYTDLPDLKEKPRVCLLDYNEAGGEIPRDYVMNRKYGRTPSTEEEELMYCDSDSCVDGDCITEKCDCWKSSLPRRKKDGTFPLMDYYKKAIVLCGPECGCRGRCNNGIDLTKHQYEIEVFRASPTMGFSIRALEPIPLGALVMQFTGEVVTGEQLEARDKGLPDKPHQSYALDLYNPDEQNEIRFLPPSEKYGLGPDTNLFVDPYEKGNIARFCAHGCFPNLLLMRVFQNNLRAQNGMIVMMASEPILPGEVLMFDYGPFYLEQNLENRCLCGTFLCATEAARKETKIFTADEVFDKYHRRLLYKIAVLKRQYSPEIQKAIFMTRFNRLPPPLPRQKEPAGPPEDVFTEPLPYEFVRPSEPIKTKETGRGRTSSRGRGRGAKRKQTTRSNTPHKKVPAPRIRLRRSGEVVSDDEIVDLSSDDEQLDVQREESCEQTERTSSGDLPRDSESPEIVWLD